MGPHGRAHAGLELGGWNGAQGSGAEAAPTRAAAWIAAQVGKGDEISENGGFTVVADEKSVVDSVL